MDNDHQEPPRKKKKSNKSKKSKKNIPSNDEPGSKHATPPTNIPPALPCETVQTPPLPELGESSQTSADCIGDNDLDLASILADRMETQDSVDDCVLPTVPSFADMFQSDICSSIASAESSLDDAETPSPSSERPIFMKAEPIEISDQSMSLSTENETDNPLPQPPTDNLVPQTVTSADLKMEPAMPASEEIKPPLPPEPVHDELTQHAHDLLDSVSNSSLGSATPASASNSVQNNTAGSEANKTNQENAEGYTLMTRYLIKDIVPKLQLEALPEGWKELIHETGMSVYCHLPTRVVTWSRPYNLLDRYAKSHAVPVGTIPCMVYKRCKDAQAKAEAAKKGAENLNGNAGSDVTHTINNTDKVSTNSTNKSDTSNIKQQTQSNGAPSEQSSNPSNESNDTEDDPTKKFPDLVRDKMIEYCKPIFQFETKEFKKFTNWRVRKEHEKSLKYKQVLENTPEDKTKIIIPVTDLPEADQKDDRGKLKRDFIIIPSTRTVMDVFTAYINWAWKKVPSLEVNVAPEGFEAKLKVKGGDIMYGYGTGPTKKSAKERAAAHAIGGIVPKYSESILSNVMSYDRAKSDIVAGLEEYYKAFDLMPIKDERVTTMSRDSHALYPIVLLKACIRRNFAMAEDAIKVTTVEGRGRHNTITCDMTVGTFKVEGVRGKNTKIVTNYAAQDILQQLHPHLATWGSILRLYGLFARGSTYEQQADLAEQQQITSLQHAESRVNDDQTVCKAVLGKLKDHMKQIYRAKRTCAVSKRKFGQPVLDESVLPMHNAEIRQAMSGTVITEK